MQMRNVAQNAYALVGMCLFLLGPAYFAWTLYKYCMVCPSPITSFGPFLKVFLFWGFSQFVALLLLSRKGDIKA